MNKLRFENTYYEEALDYAKQFFNTKEEGYCNLELTRKYDQIITQHNNTILALLTSLHYRFSLLENRLLTVERQNLGNTQAMDWKEASDNLNKDLSKLSLGKTITRKHQLLRSF